MSTIIGVLLCLILPVGLIWLQYGHSVKKALSWTPTDPRMELTRKTTAKEEAELFRPPSEWVTDACNQVVRQETALTYYRKNPQLLYPGHPFLTTNEARRLKNIGDRS